MYTTQFDTSFVERLTTKCFRVDQGDIITLSLAESGANRVCVNFLPASVTNINEFSVGDGYVEVNSSHEYTVQYTLNPLREWEDIGTFIGYNRIKVENSPGWNYFRIKQGDSFSEVKKYNSEVDERDYREFQYGANVIRVTPNGRKLLILRRSTKIK